MERTPGWLNGSHRLGKAMDTFTQILGLLMIALMLYVTWNDIARFIAPLFGG